MIVGYTGNTLNNNRIHLLQLEKLFYKILNTTRMEHHLLIQLEESLTAFSNRYVAEQDQNQRDGIIGTTITGFTTCVNTPNVETFKDPLVLAQKRGCPMKNRLKPIHKVKIVFKKKGLIERVVVGRKRGHSWKNISNN